MQRTADFHDQIADTDRPKAARVVDDATALDAAVDRLDAHATACDASIRRPRRAGEFASPGLASWHDDLDLGARKGQEAQILEQPAARGSRVWGRIRNPLIVGAAGTGVTEKEAGERGVHQQHVFHRAAPRPNGAMLLHHLGDRHPDQVRPYLERMQTEDIATVAAEAYEVIEDQ